MPLKQGNYLKWFRNGGAYRNTSNEIYELFIPSTLIYDVSSIEWVPQEN